jgi:hypothetical protein
VVYAKKATNPISPRTTRTLCGRDIQPARNAWRIAGRPPITHTITAPAAA